MRSIVPIDHLEVICNGAVTRELQLGDKRDTADVEGILPVADSGWCLLRAWSEKAHYPILDLYPYATTSPVYVNVAGAPLRSARDAAYFIAWMERLISAAENSSGWNTETERKSVLTIFEKAKQRYDDIAKSGQ